MNRLAGRFRLLLLAFPRHYRRSRGAEMLTTLLDGSSPGQQRPTLRSAMSVVWSGLRCRFRLRPGKFHWVAAAATTLAGALAGATLGTWAAWSWAASPLPSEAAAEAIVRSIVANEPRSRERSDFIFGDDNSLGLAVPGNVWYSYDTEESGPIQDQAMQALRANGWAVSSWSCQGCLGTGGVAVKDDMRVTVFQSDLFISRATPPTVPWFLAIGALLGAYGGWMLIARTGRLLARRAPWQRAAVASGATAGFLMLLPAVYFTVTYNILYYIAHDYSPDLFPRAPFFVLHWDQIRNITLPGLAVILIAVVFAELPPRRTSESQSIAR